MLTKQAIVKYFTAEKQESLLFIAVGLLAIIIAAIGLLKYKTNAWQGAALPLIGIGLLQLVVGYTIYKRSDDDLLRVVYAYEVHPNDIKTAELPRMNVVNKNFVIYRWVEVLLAITGLVFLFYNRDFVLQQNLKIAHYTFTLGWGLALLLQSIIMLSADYFAEKRAAIYHKQLQSFVKISRS